MMITMRLRWRFGRLGYTMLWLYGRWLILAVVLGLDPYVAMAMYEPAVKAMVQVEVIG